MKTVQDRKIQVNLLRVQQKVLIATLSGAIELSEKQEDKKELTKQLFHAKNMLRYANFYLSKAVDDVKKSNLSDRGKKEKIELLAPIPALWNMLDYFFMISMILGLLAIVAGVYLFFASSSRISAIMALGLGFVVGLTSCLCFFLNASGTSTSPLEYKQDPTPTTVSHLRA